MNRRKAIRSIAATSVLPLVKLPYSPIDLSGDFTIDAMFDKFGVTSMHLTGIAPHEVATTVTAIKFGAYHAQG